jgi:hypothetical protein
MEMSLKITLIIIAVVLVVYLLTLFYHWIRFYTDYSFISQVKASVDYMKSDEWYTQMLDVLIGRGSRTRDFVPYSHTDEEKEKLVKTVRFLNQSEKRLRIVSHRYQCRPMPTKPPPDWLVRMGFAFVLLHADAFGVLSFRLLEARLDERREFVLNLLNPSVLLEYILKVLKAIWVDILGHFRGGD